ncbi:hypothetical protein DL240_06680 [Lujinxingia litoralis]|uniref:Uncharacterized protein n=1 Tax=Lujinxingia litoralis TaxID=2211119 RepID=A0A328C9K6_9DELT|nr:hypothetical protein [Lujinxingia litoralis]RAL23832.1 hypothetical protein DL240_06680 [Lujinxingia litoralis]
MRHLFARSLFRTSLLLSAGLLTTACNIGDTANRPPTPEAQVDGGDTSSEPDPQDQEDTGTTPDPDQDADPEPESQVGSMLQQRAGAREASSPNYRLRMNLGAPTAAPAESANHKVRPAVGAGN